MEKEAASVTAKEKQTFLTKEREKQLAREDSQLRLLTLKDTTIKGVHVLHKWYSCFWKGVKLHTKFEIFETFFKISRLKPNISNLK